MAIHFFQEDIQFDLPNKTKTKRWLTQLAAKENFSVKELNYVFCSDEYLHKINVEYLGHDTYTDIITFDNSDEDYVLEGDIFVSIDRIKDNAALQKDKFILELLRVLSHGLYHLCGYKDKLEQEIVIMRSKEDAAISDFESIA